MQINAIKMLLNYVPALQEHYSIFNVCSPQFETSNKNRNCLAQYFSPLLLLSCRSLRSEEH